MSLRRRFVTYFRKLAWICDRDIQACHRLKDKDRAIVKFTNRNDCLQILRVKRKLKGPDPAAVDLPEETKIYFCQWEFVPLLSGDMEQM